MRVNTWCVVQRTDGAWQVIGAQSTRVPRIAPRVTPSVSGAVSDYTGDYLGGGGGTVRIALTDSVLTLTPPTGASLQLEPIGPGLFEAIVPGSSGVRMQFLFARDASGRVVSLSRIYNGDVQTWSRMQ